MRLLIRQIPRCLEKMRQNVSYFSTNTNNVETNINYWKTNYFRSISTPPKTNSDIDLWKKWWFSNRNLLSRSPFSGASPLVLGAGVYLVGGWTTHLKNVSQIGSFPQIGMKINNIWNHQPDIHSISLRIIGPSNGRVGEPAARILKIARPLRNQDP